jgi:hypothetical protein
MEGDSDVLLNIGELGTLNKTSEDESRFIGSASGVAFVNTVRQAFSRSEAGCSEDPPSAHLPTSEETIAARDGLFEEGTTTADERPSGESVAAGPHAFLPSKDVAKELMVLYFKTWHPLFPFLHGPTYLQRLEAMYSDAEERRTSSSDMCWAVIFRCTFNIAAFSRRKFQLPARTRLDSAAKTQSILNGLLGKNDIPSLQALLSLQLYLVITMSLHMASTVSGCIVRSILHSGLHRCPFRYKTFSSHDRQLRKRIFWTAYCIDRYLSLALGLPLGIQDSDVDVCLPALEVHQAGKHDRKPSEYICVAPIGPRMDEACIHHDTESNVQNQQETPLRSFAVYSRLTGTALELIHKSIKVRSISWKAMFHLTSDIHSWWDTLSPIYEDSRQGRNSEAKLEPAEETALEPDLFFAVLYHHMILIIKRPMLSLDPASSDFNSALQSSIGAAKNIVRRLYAHPKKVFIWPGFLSALWMAGLVIAFSSRLNRLCEYQGIQDITQCLSLLEAMGDRWVTAKRCHTILSDLLVDLQKDHRLPGDKNRPVSTAAPTPTQTAAQHSKRRRLDADSPSSRRSAASGSRHRGTPRQEDASHLSEGTEFSWPHNHPLSLENQEDHGGRAPRRPLGRPSTDQWSMSNQWDAINMPITPNTAVGDHHPTDQRVTNMLPGMGFPAESTWGMMFAYSNAEFITTSPSNVALPYGNTSFDAFVSTVGRYEDILDV